MPTLLVNDIYFLNPTGIEHDDLGQFDRRFYRDNGPFESLIHKTWNQTRVVQMRVRKQQVVNGLLGDRAIFPVAS